MRLTGMPELRIQVGEVLRSTEQVVFCERSNVDCSCNVGLGRPSTGVHNRQLVQQRWLSWSWQRLIYKSCNCSDIGKTVTRLIRLSCIMQTNALCASTCFATTATVWKHSLQEASGKILHKQDAG